METQQIMNDVAKLTKIELKEAIAESRNRIENT